MAVSSVCVFCGSSPGADAAFTEAATELGQHLARRELTLVYGGAQVGLMGAVANAALEAGGQVHGVITRALVGHEIAHRDLTRLTIVETMHERKAAMADLADAFVMLPGGFGSLDEFFEAVTWRQLGIHAKPCGVLNVSGYFDALHAFLERAVTERLIRAEHHDMLVFDASAESLLDRLARAEAKVFDKWLDRSDR